MWMCSAYEQPRWKQWKITFYAMVGSLSIFDKLPLRTANTTVRGCIWSRNYKKAAIEIGICRSAHCPFMGECAIISLLPLRFERKLSSTFQTQIVSLPCQSTVETAVCEQLASITWSLEHHKIDANEPNESAMWKWVEMYILCGTRVVSARTGFQQSVHLFRIAWQ